VVQLDARFAIDALAHRRDELKREILAVLPVLRGPCRSGGCGSCAGLTLTAVGSCSSTSLMFAPVRHPRGMNLTERAVRDRGPSLSLDPPFEDVAGVVRA